MFKKSFYSHVGANEPIVAGTIKLGSTKGRGSSTRMFNYCNQRSANPSECINQFITVNNGNNNVVINGNPPSAPFINNTIPGDKEITINFTPPLDTGGLPITNYLYTTDISLNIFQSAGTTTSPFTITGLVNGRQYNIAIKAVNIKGSSPPSNSVITFPVEPPFWQALIQNDPSYNNNGFNGPVNSIGSASYGGFFIVGGDFTDTYIPSTLYPPKEYSCNVQGINDIYNTYTSSDFTSSFGGSVNVASEYFNNLNPGPQKYFYGGNFLDYYNPQIPNPPDISLNYITYNTYSDFPFNFRQLSTSNGSIGLNGPVYALKNDYVNSRVYIGGNFTTGNGTTPTIFNKIAYFDLSTNLLTSIDPINGLGLNGTVYAIDIDSSGNIYFGGDFTNLSDSSLSLNYIAKWDGAQWSSLGVGLNGIVRSITIDTSSNLYVGGNFTNLSDSSLQLNYIAKWDGIQWSALGVGLNGIVRSISLNNFPVDYIFVGGYFTNLSNNSLPLNYIAQWNTATNTWSSLLGGVNGPVYTLKKSGQQLFAGGNFTRADPTGTNIQTNYIAKYNF